MTDVTLDRYLIYGSAAARAAFTPVPGVGGTGTNLLPVWVDSDAGNAAWFWDTGSAAWVAWSASGGITQLTGDVTAGPGSGSQAATIANNAVTTAKINNSAVTLAKIANQADQTILGNNSGGAGPPIALTVAQTKTVLGLGTAATQNTGTSGANVPLLNGGNTWGALQTLSAGGDLTPAATPSTTALGYLGAPQNILAGSYTTVMSDAGKHFYHTSATPHTLTIDSNANVPYPIGTVMAGVNENGAGALTIAITSDTLRWGSSTGSRSVAANGSFSVLKVTSTVWRLTGDGIT